MNELAISDTFIPKIKKLLALEKPLLPTPNTHTHYLCIILYAARLVIAFGHTKLQIFAAPATLDTSALVPNTKGFLLSSGKPVLGQCQNSSGNHIYTRKEIPKSTAIM